MSHIAMSHIAMSYTAMSYTATLLRWFDIVKDQVIIRPLTSVAGSLSAYGKKKSIPFKEAREKAWDEMSTEKYGKKTGRR